MAYELKAEGHCFELVPACDLGPGTLAVAMDPKHEATYGDIIFRVAGITVNLSEGSGYPLESGFLCRPLPPGSKITLTAT